MAASRSKSPTSAPFRFLLKYYRPYAGRMLMALLFMLPTSGMSLFFPSLTGRLIDSIRASGNTNQLQSIGWIFLALLAAQAIIGYVVSVTMARTTEKVISGLRTDLFAHVVRLPMSILTGTRVGELSSRFSSDITQIQETFSFSLLQLLRQAVLLFGSIAVIVSTSLPLTVPILVGTPVIVGIAVLLGRKIRALSTKTQDALAQSATIVEESLQGIAAVKSFVRELTETERYRNAIAENVRLAIKGARMRAMFVTFMVFVAFGGVAGVILYGANLVAEGAVTIGNLLSFLMYAMFVGAALGSFVELYSQIQKSLGAAVRVQELMTTPTEDVHMSAQPDRYSSVELRDVHFAYPERPDIHVVRGIDLKIETGARVAFVGASGAGKSTTASLVQRLYEPTQGTILYNGQPSPGLLLGDVRASVGIVPQDIVLFGGSIEDNIRYGRLDATHEEIRQAARDANALDFIESFPEGFATTVGERGIKLSGGQRQRVAIARALLKNPSILILDEATSALDAESEGLIQQALERLMHGRTVIIIAHRLSTVRVCDRIFVFEGGTIVEQGSHAELLARPGLYKRWCDLQFITS